MSRTPTQPPPPLEPFDPAAFRRRMAVSAAVHQGLIALTCVLLAAVLFMPALVGPETQRLATLVAVLIIPALWLPISLTTTKAARDLAPIGVAIAHNPEQAERVIANTLRRRPVMRWARLLTYHRLAVLRHKQRRFEETAAICQHVLAQPLNGPAASARSSLLLMLTEAQLGRNHLPGAYESLTELHETRLGLAGALQRLALQTRYALKAGHYDHALDHGRQKMELAELMPPPQCGAMHAMLADAAHKTGRNDLARWLWERAELISPPGLLDQLRQGAFEVEVVDPEQAEA